MTRREGMVSNRKLAKLARKDPHFKNPRKMNWEERAALAKQYHDEEAQRKARAEKIRLERLAFDDLFKSGVSSVIIKKALKLYGDYLEFQKNKRTVPVEQAEVESVTPDDAQVTNEFLAEQTEETTTQDAIPEPDLSESISS